jgi:hypothetical protein
VPNILIILHIVQQIGDSTLANIIIPTSKLPKNTNLPILAQPGRRLGKALAADRGARAGL